MGGRIKEDARRTDFAYLALCACLSLISVVTLFAVAQYGGIVYSGRLGNWKPALTQIFASLLGMGCALLLSLADHRRLLELWPVHAGVCWGLVLLTFIPGVGYAPAGTASQSWIALPLGLSIQPAELAKISFILTFCRHLQLAQGQVNRPQYLLPLLAHIAAPVLVVHWQGDDGTAMCFLFIGLVLLVMAGLNRWVVFGCCALGLAGVVPLWRNVLTPHQKSRVLGLFFPERYLDTTMYQQLQGRQAISAGGLFGRGLFSENHHYVPRSENDFIFSFFAEGCGFLGCLVLLGLLFGLLFKTLAAAARAPGRSGAYICMGVFATLLFQTVINLGMNLMLLPVMGLTLPFVSAGGTSVLLLYLLTGLVLGVERQGRAVCAAAAVVVK